MALYQPLDGDTNLKYKLLCFFTPNKKISKRKALALNRDGCCHLALCLQLILLHCLVGIANYVHKFNVMRNKYIFESSLKAVVGFVNLQNKLNKCSILSKFFII
jgi:hypothetical protein